MTRKDFIEALFDIDDLVAWGKNDAYCRYPKSPWPEMLHTEAVKFCINPLSGPRKTSNVTQINSLLFEMDKDSDGNIIPFDEQVRLFNESGLPYTTMVWSGTKSVHCIVRLDKPVPEKLFRPLWLAIERVLAKKGCWIDPATMKIPQISRMPGSYRDGHLQRLINVKKRVSLQQLGQWLKANGETVKKPKPPKPIKYNLKSSYGMQSKWNFAYNGVSKFRGEYVPYAATGNHMWLFEFGKQCYVAELPYDDAIYMSKQKWGETYNTSGNGPQDISTPIIKGWQWKHNNQS